MNKEQYVTFEIAKLLKEKGFDWGCNGHWYIGETKTFEISPSINPINWNEVKTDLDWLSCPTQQMACDWLEETYGLFIKIGRSMDINSNYYYSYNVLDKDNTGQIKSIRPSKEEAIGAALLYCLKNII